jgi:hypothetical protein
MTAPLVGRIYEYAGEFTYTIEDGTMKPNEQQG